MLLLPVEVLELVEVLDVVIVLHLLYQLRVHGNTLIFLHVLDLKLSLYFEFKGLNQVVVQNCLCLFWITFFPTRFIKLTLVFIQLKHDLFLDVVEVKALLSLRVFCYLDLYRLLLKLHVNDYQHVQGSMRLLRHVLHVRLNTLNDLTELWIWCKR